MREVALTFCSLEIVIVHQCLNLVELVEGRYVLRLSSRVAHTWLGPRFDTIVTDSRDFGCCDVCELEPRFMNVVYGV